MPRVLEFELQDDGWATAAIQLNDELIVLDASYICDTFVGIADALVRAYQGEKEVEWLYFHEPATTYVMLKRDQLGTQLKVLAAKDGFRLKRPQLGYETVVIAEGKVQLRTLVADIVTAGSRMLDKFGDDGYRKRWRHSFPHKQIDTLKRLRRDAQIPDD
jgi:hypothetical protein